ncbi:PEP-CTERM system histidine kinase PrsK [Herbaspirillum lusitanum]|uniref:histidine kinase n=1 Tax=Herbaspirillum lusitanum TaxID=213312 RepID=A0ABW9A415_9BURK
MEIAEIAGVALIGYITAALGFLLFGGFLLATAQGQLRRRTLAATSLISAAWAGAVLLGPFLPASLRWLPAVLELLRDAGWSAFMLLLLGAIGQSERPAVARINSWTLVVAGFYLVNLLACLSVSWEYAYPIKLSAFMAVTIFRVASAVLGLFLVEQLYRNTVAEQRWGIKFACLGIGLMFAYDFYMYSDAMLFRQINPDIWNARGMVNTLAVPLVAVSAWRNPKWSLGLTVSRRILFHSAALFGTAIYLLAMASAGYALRIFGGNWGSVMQVAFLFGAAILLLGVLFSGGMRSRLRVFISKHFYRYNYDYREEWLAFTRALSEKGPGLEQRVIQALAKLVESPAGAVFTLPGAAQVKPSDAAQPCEVTARWNMAIDCEADTANHSLLRFLEQKQWVIDLQEYAADPARYEDLRIPLWLGRMAQAWLVVPLEVHGALFGFVVLARPRTPLKLNWEVIDLLKVAGSQAGGYLAQQRFATELMVARQFESFNRMSTFIVHDLKNLVSQLSLLMANAERHKDNPEFQRDMIDTVDFSVQKMKLLLHKLSRKDSAETHAPVRVDALLQRAIAAKSAAEPRPSLEVRHPALVVMADQERLERVLGHIIQNAIEATSPKSGTVAVSAERNGERVLISVKDNGLGMSSDFIRDRLFKPFESTKSAGMGIGLFESREYILALGGELHVDSQEAAGTHFRILLPLQAALGEAAA